MYWSPMVQKIEVDHNYVATLQDGLIRILY
jgi:hypothetical protein